MLSILSTLFIGLSAVLVYFFDESELKRNFPRIQKQKIKIINSIVFRRPNIVWIEFHHTYLFVCHYIAQWLQQGRCEKIESPEVLLYWQYGVDMLAFGHCRFSCSKVLRCRRTVCRNLVGQFCCSGIIFNVQHNLHIDNIEEHQRTNTVDQSSAADCLKFSHFTFFFDKIIARSGPFDRF